MKFKVTLLLVQQILLCLLIVILQVRELNSANGGDVQVSSINQDNDGLHIKVNHKNHGMYFSDNKVEISGVQSDVKPTKLTSAFMQLQHLPAFCC